MRFSSLNEAILAYENKYITLQSRISVRRTKKRKDGTVASAVVDSTLGRFLFNEIIPQDLGFVDRDDPANELALEVDFHTGKKHLKKILTKVINVHGATVTAEVLDKVKAMGYKYSTISAMTVSISDMTVPPEKPQLIQEAQETVDRITRNYQRGFVTEEERYREVVETWKETDAVLTKKLLDGLDKYNNIFMMADSGARGSDKQIKQLAGMRGLMAGLPVCADLWQIRPVTRSSFLSSPISVKVLTFWSTSCPRTAPARVCPIRLSVQPTQVI